MFEDQDQCSEASKGPGASQDTPETIKEKVKFMTKHCKAYEGADDKRALWQVINTIVPFFAVCTLMFHFYETAYWLTLLLSPLASLLLVRIFIIQHDCGHEAFFSKRKWNNAAGRFMSLFTWTPYDFWRRTHNMHHAGSGNLDNRGFGAIETITTEEYKALPKNLQFWYRIYRNPFLLILLGTPFFIIIGQRFAHVEPFPFYETAKKISYESVYKSVRHLNLSLLAFYGFLGAFIGFDVLLLTYLPIVYGTAVIGGWLFYIQHQFEDAHWENHEDWDYHEAAVMGSSHYDLHPVLHWFTGNIGLHHIHHLNAKVPNYRLHKCLNECKELQNLNRIKLFESFKYAKLALWDKQAKKMITFDQYKDMSAA